ALVGGAVALELVVAVTTVELVRAALALQQVGAAGTQQNVVAVRAHLVPQREGRRRVTVDHVLTTRRLWDEGVVAVQRARPGVAADDVDGVVARPAVEVVAIRPAVERVVAGAAVETVGA